MEDYIVREGTVLKAESGRVIVRMDPAEGPEECGGCGSCAVKSLCRGRGDGHMDLAAAVGERATFPSPGDRVKVAYRSANPAVASLAMFAPSLLGLAAGGFAASRLDAGDAVFVFGCGVGFLVGLGVTFAAVRLLPSLRSEARLVPPSGGA